MLTRDQILAAPTSATKTVSVPEWGGDVAVRVMSGTERERFEAQVDAAKGSYDSNVRGWLCAMCICDEKGNRLFTEEDVALLGARSGVALQRVWLAAIEFNGLKSDSVKEAEKNSGTGPN